MMSTILTLIILAMVFQGVLAVLNSILDTVGVGSMLSGLPVVGSNLNLIWAYLFVTISRVASATQAPPRSWAWVNSVPT